MPYYTSEAFPREFTHYSVPLLKAPKGCRTKVLFSVDWEKDHGRWRSGPTPTYHGIELASQALCELLDRLKVPCTWFVEVNPCFPELDMPSACAEELSALTDRKQDEIGLHVHWGNFASEVGGPVDLTDRGWMRKQVRASTERLQRVVPVPLASFRSGGHTLVPGLPELLQELSYLADLSVEDRRSPTIRLLQGLVGYGTVPYHPDRDFANRQGHLQILEIPTHLHLHDFGRLVNRLSRFLIRGRANLLSLYIHIDELTRPQQGCLDLDRLEGVEMVLSRLAQLPEVEFLTASQYARQQRPESGV